MDLLNRITLRSRLQGAAALMLLLFLAFGWFSLHEMNTLSDTTWTLYNHPFQVSNAALRVGLGVNGMQTSLREGFLARTESELAKAIQELREAQREAYDNLGIVRDLILGAEGKALEHDTRELLDGWVKMVWEEVHLTQQGNKAAAVALSLGRGDELFHRLVEKTLDLRKYAQNKAATFMANVARQQQQIQLIAIWFFAGAMLLAILIASFLLRKSMADLLDLKQTMAAITRTGLLEQAAVTGANEVTDMARDFNRLVDRLQSQFWLKDGVAALNQELSGDWAAARLADRGLNFIARHVGACTGAIYTQEQAGAGWVLQASYALGEGAYLTPQFKEGEGIVGQVAAAKTPIFLNDIGRADAVALSGTVCAPPRSLYALPLLYQEELSGVLEVAAFIDLDAGKREFLDAAAAAVAVSLSIAGKRDHIATLLKASQEVNEELTVMNEELQAQSEELQTQAEELERQRVQVEEADRLKSEFLSNMSHELRTPLNSVLTLTQLMQSRGTGVNPAQDAEYLQVMERNGRHLLHLINDLLDISRIEAGQVRLTLTEIDPKTVCVRALETVRPLAAQRGLELNADYGELSRMYTDEAKLQQILINLLSNAVKFTDQGKITLQVTSAGGRFHFVVRDTGVGIAPAILPFIFDKFRQADGSSTRQFDGTGLGLAISRSLAGILGGEIGVESALGQGSTFTLSLPPRCPSPPGAQGPVPARSAAPQPLAIRRNPPLVLVVEDNPVAALQIRTVLEEQGYTVGVVPDGAEALISIARIRPDGIILDLMMPKMDGFQVLEQIRANPQTAAIPVLVLTAKELTRNDQDRLAHNHIQQFIQKGALNREELAAAVRRMLGPAAGREDGHLLVVEDTPDNLW
jgi:signal transduction histidine kinase/HAMP domain-containing protein